MLTVRDIILFTSARRGLLIVRIGVPAATPQAAIHRTSGAFPNPKLINATSITANEDI